MTHQPPAIPETYYAPGWSTAPRPRLDGLAVASLITSLVGLGLLAVGLGIAALVRIRQGTTRGRGLALAGVVVGAVVTIGQGLLVTSLAGDVMARRPLPLEVEAPVEAPAARLRTGHCLGELPPDGAVGRVHVVPCGEQHAAQVISEYRFPVDAVWPGQAGADARVATGCRLSTAEVDAGVEAVTWAPTEASWADGDRTGLCVAYRDAGLTGSLLDGSADLG